MIDSFLLGSRLLRAAPPVVDEGVLGAGRRGGERRGRDRLELIVLQLDEAGRMAGEPIQLAGGQGGAIEGVLPGADDVGIHRSSPSASRRPWRGTRTATFVNISSIG